MDKGEKYKEDYRRHLIKKYRLPEDATWDQINTVCERVSAERQESVVAEKRYQEIDHKLGLLHELQEAGVLRELCPVSDGVGGTAYWHYHVERSDDLPASLQEEFQRLGEVRW